MTPIKAKEHPYFGLNIKVFGCHPSLEVKGQIAFYWFYWASYTPLKISWCEQNCFAIGLNLAVYP
jgi:hypothetical protein